MDITRHAEATAVLSDTRYIPPPVPQGAPRGTLAWLRAQVSRFATGEVHAARRALVSEQLAMLDPDALRKAARTAAADGRDWSGIPTAVLGQALGVTDDRLLPAVEAASTGYLSGETSRETDAAVAVLLELLDAGDEATTVARISLLLQGHAATQGLVRNALAHAEPGDPPMELLHETLRHDPPLKATRRLDRETGQDVTIDLVSVNHDPAVFPEPGRFDLRRGQTPHLTFGYGVRPCPGSDHALALAAGILEGLLP
ncbi:cytochrome P450 [Nonomuraea sp. NPDC050536]|uniref:cytochrome P450 n=1 Tax=Nonomuraea sp. NPDC050536 TaxID=3364366 RepID=UPI0037CAA954